MMELIHGPGSLNEWADRFAALNPVPGRILVKGFTLALVGIRIVPGDGDHPGHGPALAQGTQLPAGCQSMTRPPTLRT